MNVIDDVDDINWDDCHDVSTDFDNVNDDDVTQYRGEEIMSSEDGIPPASLLNQLN